MNWEIVKKYKYFDRILSRPEYILAIDNDITKSKYIQELYDGANEILSILTSKDKTNRTWTQHSDIYDFCEVNNLPKALKALNSKDSYER